MSIRLPNEISFLRIIVKLQHFRDFRTEMPRQWLQKGFWEAGPNRTAQDLLLLPLLTRNTQRKSSSAVRRVAITSRFGHKSDSKAHEYVEARQRRGVQARIVSGAGRSALEDFCFLMHAKVLLGVGKSTFTRFAGFLQPRDALGRSDSSRVVIYGANRVGQKRLYESPDQTFQAVPEMERFEYILLENVTDWS